MAAKSLKLIHAVQVVDAKVCAAGFLSGPSAGLTMGPYDYDGVPGCLHDDFYCQHHFDFR